MAFLNQAEISQIKDKLVDDPSILKKLYNAKNNEYDIMSVSHGLVDDYIKDGWETVGKPLKTKTKIRKLKSHSRKFEDDIWCQLYRLGYRNLNFDDQLKLPYGKEEGDKKQIDVLAVDKETVILVECKSSAELKKTSSLKTEFEGLEKRMNGFQKSIKAIFGTTVKMRYIYATRNLRIDPDGSDIKRLKEAKGFYYNDKSYHYIESIIKSYKNAAHYQFIGMLFKGQTISPERIEIPAVEGSMGDKKYYMFSLEPKTILKIGFILHRTKANESEMPTYQRLLVPSRLKDINAFINNGGYFPNSIIINFSEGKNKITFEPRPRAEDTSSRFGMLKIPNAYAIAYIIDGQHRVYGYANTNYLCSNTIPVVAFTNLAASEQLEIFMSINENQKAVKASLRATLACDLLWNSDTLSKRLEALRSSVIIKLAESVEGALYNKIEVGEDTAPLKFKPLIDALKISNLLPQANGNNYAPNSIHACLYNTNRMDHSDEMEKAARRLVEFINLCFGLVENEYQSLFNSKDSKILCNPGAYSYLAIVGSLNEWLTIKKRKLTLETNNLDRYNKIKPYLEALLKRLSNLSQDEEERFKGKYGTGGYTIWLRTFQLFINEAHQEYDPPELTEWKERQDKNLLTKGREFGESIEKYTKKHVIDSLKRIYKDDWEYEINSIVTACEKLARDEDTKNYQEGYKQEKTDWTEMLKIMDYKTMVEKFWTKSTDEADFKTFQKRFSIDTGEGIGSKAKALKWMSRFNSLRNHWAHAATKNKGLSADEVKFLQKIHDELCNR